MTRLPLLAAAIAIPLAGPAMAADKPELTVYTYDSFVSDWGPGPAVVEAFEATCDCTLKLVGVGDGAAILSRLKLEGGRTRADVVLGLDTNLTAEAVETGLFALHGQTPDALDLPVDWTDPIFLPFDWGYFAFVYDTTRTPEAPASFEALLAAPEDLSLVIQDPRSSTPGLGLLMWVKSIYGDKAGEVWKTLAPRIVTTTPGWSEAYGMFLEGEADMVLSYTTSPAYHRIAEGDETKEAAIFDEGHYMQVEVAGKIAGTDEPELADAFLAFMLSDAFQSIIPETNWMYPAVLPEGGLPDGFGDPLPAEKALLLDPAEARGLRDAALDEWRAALSQ
ncbi:thiamine ABC transporter substrate binding subunit [Oceanomicrobium pacificus]|uniref:Thiamine-binding periplasmic protein n=1 Tax=Oceanomicrobium pacificus TaxID=2692916 RepID=A0A6B0TT19_9RHOB|nr:thiamine ABC transporter substrate binding subunit [Oceanomicrobium pacificus]MXU64945.1 thiamine ABC transporter substrate binding subunit [Oceanomicrobium pacificus]